MKYRHNVVLNTPEYVGIWTVRVCNKYTFFYLYSVSRFEIFDWLTDRQS
jgi:hypothetical protein